MNGIAARACLLSNGEQRKCYLFVAIDRCSRSVHLAVAPKRAAFAAEDDETERSVIAFLREAAAAFPFRLTQVLTDNGSCFTAAFAKTCADLGAQYRHIRPRTPQTNGMVERFNRRISSEVLGINIYSHRAMEQVLRGFNAAYNARRQRVLDSRTPNQVVAERPWEVSGGLGDAGGSGMTGRAVAAREITDGLCRGWSRRALRA